MKSSNKHLGACETVDVLHIKDLTDGASGKYFFFSESDFEKMVGKNENWDGKKFDVVQSGSRNWGGKIVVWKGSENSGAHGRRDKDSKAGQWAPGDTIELKSCSQAGT